MAVPGAWGLRAGPGLTLVTLFISSSLLSFPTPSPTGPVLGDPLPSSSGGEGKVPGLGPLPTVTEAGGSLKVLGATSASSRSEPWGGIEGRQRLQRSPFSFKLTFLPGGWGLTVLEKLVT